jgi:O-antigen ligase
MLSLVAGLAFIAITWAFGKSRERSTGGLPAVLRPLALVALVAASILAGIFWVGADLSVAERLAQQGTENPAGRYGIWGDTLKLIASNPITGVGLGAYQTAFTAFSSGDGSLIIEYAHNDYLQVLSDAGIVGGALAIWFLVVLGRSFVKAIRTEDARMRATALGCGGGIFALLVHSLFDFNLQIPSNALLFLLLCAAVSSIGAGFQPAVTSRR